MFGQVLILFQPYRDPDLGFRLGINAGRRRPRQRSDHSQNPSGAAYRHAFTQGNLRGHSKRKFDYRTFVERNIAEEKDTARTQVLRESDTFGRIYALAQGNRKQIGESLSDPAFNPHWKSGHTLTSLPNRQKPRKPL
jgi:hypothetical protein